MEKEELAARYGVNLEDLEKEQVSLVKNIKLKDGSDFSTINTFGAIENIMIQNKIISAAIVCDKDYEIIEQEYFVDKLRFPYIFGFESYREMPNMVSVFAKLREKPDVLFIKGEGLNHQRIGIANHLALSINNPVIGINDKLFEDNEVVNDDIIKEGKVVGKTFVSKQGSRAINIFPGNEMSADTALNIVKGIIVPPHKFPEPMVLSQKYAKNIKKELKII
jgi:deoxyribonuclease V